MNKDLLKLAMVFAMLGVVAIVTAHIIIEKAVELEKSASCINEERIIMLKDDVVNLEIQVKELSKEVDRLKKMHK